MTPFKKHRLNNLDVQTLPLAMYAFRFSLDRLVLGVDNIRYDVRLSPSFREVLKSNVLQLIAKFSQASTILEVDPPPIQAQAQASP